MSANVHRERILYGAGTLVALVFTGFLAADFGAIVAAIYRNADIVSTPYIGELYPSAPAGATTVLGFLPWYTSLWFELATRHVPFHRELWEVGPWVASVASVALLAWATARTAGRWAGMLVALVLACAGPTLLVTQFAIAQHGATVLHVVLLDAFLVLLITRGGAVGRRTLHWTACLLVAVLTAVGAASDNLVFPAGLVPFAAAGGVAALLYPRATARRLGASLAVVTVLSVVCSRIVVWAMRAQHVYAAEKTYAFSSWDGIGAHVRQFLQSVATVLNANFSGARIEARSLLQFVCAAALTAGAVAGYKEVRRWYAELRPRLERGRLGDEAFALKGAQLTFWSLAILLSAAAFVFSNFAQENAGRYFVSAAYGLVVILAIASASRSFPWRAAATAGACLVVVSGVVGIASRDLQSNPGHYPLQSFANTLKTFAQGEGLTVGYAAYWVAAPLGWEMHADVQVYPVIQCSGPHGLCTYPLHAISSWYTPRASTRTFLVTDPRYGPAPPGKRLGGAAEVVTFGEYTVYVYDYDIASNLADWHRYVTPE